jgi:cell division protein ZapA
MEKTKVRLQICGTEYTISSAEDDADYMRSLGAELDAKMHELQEENPRLSITQCAVLCALDYLDAFKKAESGAENLRSQIQDYLEDAARARTDSEITKRELDRVAKELAALRAKQG